VENTLQVPLHWQKAVEHMMHQTCDSLPLPFPFANAEPLNIFKLKEVGIMVCCILPVSFFLLSAT
ncbi:hypothetical protein M422DRAFT_37948, partial [Sphaerobolus stellatus SS14]